MSTYDADITSACAAASRGIDGVCQRRFWADADATSERYYDAPFGKRRLPIDDLVTLGSVKLDMAGDGTFDTTITNNTDFVLKPYNAPTATPVRPYEILELHSRSTRYFPAYPRNVKVTGKFGWAAVPDEIVRATTILAIKLYKRQDSPMGVLPVGLDNESAIRIAQSDPDVRFLLSNYVRVW